MFRISTTKKIVASLVVCMLIVIGVSTPLNHSGVQKADAQLEALGAIGGLMGVDLGSMGPIGDLLGGMIGLGGGGDAVRIVEDISPSSIARTAANISQTLSLTKQEIKEQVLDPLFWKLGNATIGEMVSSMVEWVNDTGEGNPAFITDLEQYLSDSEDLAATEFFENPGLNALCESTAVEVKSVLEKNYALSRQSDNAAIENNRCDLNEHSPDEKAFRDGDFAQGGWGAWFMLTEDDPLNDVYRQTLALKEKTKRAREIDTTEAIMNEGFLSVENCESYDAASGRGRNCKTTTPGSIVQDQLVNALNLPGLRVAFAGELDESLGAMMSNLFTQAFRGTNGLLGLGGNDQYTDRRYGSGGDTSYLDGLSQETSESIAGSSTANTIQALIQTLFDYTAVLLEIITIIDDLDSQIVEAQDTYGACFTTELTPKLDGVRDTAKNRALQAGGKVEQLIGYYQLLQEASTDAERAEIAIAVGTYKTQTGSQIEAATQTAERDLNQILPDLAKAVQEEIDNNIERCGAADTSGETNTTDNTASSSSDGVDV